VNDAVEHGLAQVESMLELERQLLEKGLTVDRGSSAHLHSLMVAASGSEQQKESALNAARILAASTRLKNKYVYSQLLYLRVNICSDLLCSRHHHFSIVNINFTIEAEHQYSVDVYICRNGIDILNTLGKENILFFD
jgi:hypothetical protein